MLIIAASVNDELRCASYRQIGSESFAHTKASVLHTGIIIQRLPQKYREAKLFYAGK